MNITNSILTFFILSAAIGYVAWVLVFSGVFVWGRDWLDARSEYYILTLNQRYRVFKFLRDMLKCPFCTSFHLSEMTQLLHYAFTGHFFNPIPNSGHLGELATWVALSGIGGMWGFVIGYVTGNTWHFGETEFKNQFYLKHGVLPSEDYDFDSATIKHVSEPIHENHSHIQDSEFLSLHV